MHFHPFHLLTLNVQPEMKKFASALHGTIKPHSKQQDAENQCGILRCCGERTVEEPNWFTVSFHLERRYCLGCNTMIWSANIGAECTKRKHIQRYGIRRKHDSHSRCKPCSIWLLECRKKWKHILKSCLPNSQHLRVAAGEESSSSTCHYAYRHCCVIHVEISKQA